MRKIVPGLACFIIVSVCGMVFSGTASAGNIIYVNAAATGGNLILWNKLGSDAEVTFSEIGPALSKILSTGSDDVAYLQGKFGTAVQFTTYGGGAVLSGPTDIINKKEGCVEMWIKAPLDVKNGVIQNMPSESWAVFYAVKWDGGSDYRGPTIYFGQGSGKLAYLIFTYPYGSAYTEIRDLTSTYSAGQWVHIAAAWDVNKMIDGNKSLAMYVNGAQVASSQDDIQAAEPWRDIFTLGGDYVNTQNFREGAIDNIKIWNYAKTDFSDRFHEGTLLLWNKLGSDIEVTHSEVGPNGEIIGNINFEPGQFGNGFRSAIRTGDFDIPNNYILFGDLSLGHKGCIELWYHPDWYSQAVGHVIDLFTYGNPVHGPSLNAQFNDWQNRWLAGAYDYSYQQGVSKYLVPAQTSGWSTTEPFHLAYVWDDNLSDPAQRLRIFLNGADVGILNGFWPDNPKFDNWGADFVLYLGSRQTPGDWYRHPWEPNIDAVIDNIKIWDYAKTDFSDRFTEDGSINVAPVAQSQNVTTRESTPIEITLTATDANNQALTYEITGSSANGTTTVPDANHKVTYTPNTGYYGVDSFTFRAFDGQLYSDPAMVNVTVKMNNPPILNPIGDKTVNETQTLQFAIIASDPDGDALTYSALNLPAGAVFDPVTLAFRWTPTYDQAGIYPITFKVTDVFGAEASEIIHVTVNNVDRPPVAMLTVVSVSGHTVCVSAAGSSDPDTGDTLTYRWYCEPPLGGAFGNPSYSQSGVTSTIIYPRNLPSGTYKIWLYVTDSSGQTSATSASVHINWPPVARILGITKIVDAINIDIDFWFIHIHIHTDAIYLFTGIGTDDDGIVLGYEWTSSINGRLGYAPIAMHTLSIGTHTISFRVQDLDGAWSSVVTQTVFVVK